MNMDFYLEIAGLAAIFFFIVLTIYAISAVKKLKNVLDGVEQKVNSTDLDFKALQTKAEEVLDNTNKLTEKLTTSLDSIEELKSELNTRLPEIDKILSNTNELIVSTRETTETYTNLGNDINSQVDAVISPVKKVVDTAYKGVYKPVSDSSRFVNALYKGISIFADKLSNKK